MKAPFRLQVAAVCLILAIGLLCLPAPEGGLLFQRFTGQKPTGDYMPVSRVRTEPEAETPPPTAPSLPQPASFDGASERFSKPLDFEEDASRSTDAWSAGTAGGKEAWRDNRSGMIWGPKIEMTLSSFSEENMHRAMDACAQEHPEGAWALPSGAEFDIAKAGGILKVDKDARHRWISFIVIPGMNMKMPAGRGYVPVAKEKEFSVRCIARGENAPANGYLVTDNETTLKALAE